MDEEAAAERSTSAPKARASGPARVAVRLVLAVTLAGLAAWAVVGAWRGPARPPARGAPSADARPPAAQRLAEAEQARLRAAFDGTAQEAANSLGMRFRLIPPGEFEFFVAYRTGRVRIRIARAFYLGIHEVTQAEYEAVAGANPSHFRGASRPVDSVVLDEARAFCRRLAELEGVPYRLPTVAEWRYAARANAWTRYPFGKPGSGLDDRAWHRGNSGGETHDVGQKQPNAWGLYDMHGNVWEWCEPDPDGVCYRTARPPSDLRGLSPQLLLGGSWADGLCDPDFFYYFGPPGNRFSTYGFRVAIPVP